MKIISWNVNGIRAVCQKGFLPWFKKEKADIVCLQEIKAKAHQVPPELLNLKGYFKFFNPAEKLGYSGTAVFSKQEPLEAGEKIGLKRFDKEGRVLWLRFAKFTLFNLYIPFGGRGKENLSYKLKVYDYLLDYLKKHSKEKMLLVGDFNIAHKEIDLARPKENKNNIMFTKEERERIDKLIELGFADSFRKFHPKETGHYTWWIYFANARDRNIGWRIDYCFASKALSGRLKSAFILPKVMGSDHCPVGVDIK